MSAFNDFLAQSNIEKFKKYREALISNRGNFSNGSFTQCMSIQKKNDDISKLFVHGAGSHKYGFGFNEDGTMKALERISQDIPLKIYGDFKQNFNFTEESKRLAWEETSEPKKKKLIASNLEQMIKITNVHYKTLGDRLCSR